MATINALANRLSGVAPLSVFFDTIEITGVTQPPLVEGRREYADFDYTWDFDDPTSGTWAESGKSKDADSGYVAGHVFETPGTYVVTVAIIDGDAVNESHDVTIVVTDPDTFYSTTNTVCVSTTGDFTGCPVGATQVTTSSMATVNTYLAADRRILFKRGESWNSAAADYTHVTLIDYVTIGAYGTCTSPDARGICSIAPIINARFVAGSSMFTFYDTINSRLQELRLVNTGTRDVAAGGVDSLDYLLFLRVETDAFEASGINVGTFNDLGHNQVAVVDCDLFDAYNNNLYIGSENLMIMGNQMRDTANSHICRVWQSFHGVIKHNEFSGATTDTAQGRQALKLHSPDEANIGVTITNRTKYTIVADNLFGESGPNPVSIAPQSSGNDQVLEDILIENNRGYAGYGTPSPLSNDVSRGINVSASYSTVRNNVFAGEGSDNIYWGIVVAQTGIEPVPAGNRVFNNTIYKSEAPIGEDQYIGVLIDATAIDTIVKNNLVHFNSNVAQRGAVLDSGTNSTLANNLLTDESLLVDPENVTYLSKDFRPTEDSPSVGGGIDVPIFKDFDGSTRTVNTIDIGAFEFSGTDITAATLSSPTAIATGSTTASGSVSIDKGNGTLFFIATENATELEATIRAGSSQIVNSTGAQPVAFAGLIAETTYYPHFVHEAPAANVSVIVSGASFTTLEAGIINLFTDLFDRLNEGLGISTDWTERQGNYDIVGNEVTLGAAGGTERCAHIDSSYITTADYSVISNVEISTSGFQYHGLCGRRVDFSTDDSDMYVLLYSNTGNLQLIKRISGEWTGLDVYVTALSAATPYKLELKMTGTIIEGYLDDVLRLSADDPDLTASGDAGLQNGTDGGIATGRVWIDFYVNAEAVVGGVSPSGFSSRAMKYIRNR